MDSRPETEQNVTDALTHFDSVRDAYLRAMRQVPPEGVGYLKPGDDYSLGGIAVHVNFVLEHYTNTLRSMISEDFGQCRPLDPPGQEERALARAKASLSAAEVSAELAATERLHEEAVEVFNGLRASWTREAPVLYGSATEPYPTSASTVMGWLVGHYAEHVPQIAALIDEFSAAPSGPSEAPAVVSRFNEAFGRGDVDAVMALMTDDCVFENTYPPPDGERYVGQEAVRRFWQQFFASTEAPRFETEEIFSAGDRVVSRWRFTWGGPDSGGHVRGTDLFRVRDGKVAEKLSYVKG